MMDFKLKIKDIAAHLNNRDLEKGIYTSESLILKGQGLTAIYVNSDKLIFRGSIYDEKELGPYSISALGQLSAGLDLFSMRIQPRFDPLNSFWWIDTDIQKHTFNVTRKDKLYCEGIIFKSIDVK